jgi:hypothetical protein
MIAITSIATHPEKFCSAPDDNSEKAAIVIRMYIASEVTEARLLRREW